MDNASPNFVCRLTHLFFQTVSEKELFVLKILMLPLVKVQKNGIRTDICFLGIRFFRIIKRRIAEW